MIKTAIHNLITAIRRSKMRTRLVVVFLVISLIPGLIITFVSNHVYENSITSKTAESAEQTLQLLNKNLVLTFEEYSRYISDVSVSPELQDFLMERLAGKNPTLVYRTKGFAEIGHSPAFLELMVFDANKEAASGSERVGIDNKQMEAILSSTDRSSPKDYISYYETTYGSDCIVMCRKIYDNKYKKSPVGYIAVFISPSILNEQSFPISHLGEDSSMFLINYDGIVVASQDKMTQDEREKATSMFAEMRGLSKYTAGCSRISNNDSLILCTHNKKYDLYLYSVISNRSLNEEISMTKHIVLTVCFLLFIVCFILSLLIYSSIMVPIDNIIDVCREREAGNILCQVNDNSADEIGYLSRSIDSMIKKDIQSMNELKDRDMQKRELELQKLRDQLNPHFLFNTLNTFKWIASLNGIETLRDGISSLSTLLRNTLEQKDELIPLSSEIDNLKSYCTIQVLRYAGQFNVSYYVEDEAAKCTVPRFVLQPLIENAILHGIKSSDLLLNITITCNVQNDYLCISILDDGAGFVLSDVFDKKNDVFKGVGLSNVDQRLQLYYGKNCRLSISSTPGVGTLCRITIPVCI